MPAQIFGTEAAVIMLHRALNDRSPDHASFLADVAAAGSSTASIQAFAAGFADAASPAVTDADLAARLMGNLGLTPNDALQAALRDYLTAVGVGARGVVALQLCQLLTPLEGATGALAIYAKAAAAWNNEVVNAYLYSADPSHTDPSPRGADDISGVRYTLTTNEDLINAGEYNDALSAPVVTTGSNKLATLQLFDRIDGGAGLDTLDVTFASATASLGTLRNIEQVAVKLGAAATTLDLQFTSGIVSLAVQAVEGSTAPRLNNIADLQGVALQGIGTGVTLGGTPGTSTRFALRADTVGQAGKAVTLDLAANQSSAVRTLDASLSNAHVRVDSSISDAMSQLNVVAVGANSLAMIDSGLTLRQVTVAGTGSVDLTGTTYNNIEGFDASANSGGVQAALQSALTVPIVVKGSAGGDRISVSASPNGSLLALGAGDDVLVGGDFAGAFTLGMDGGSGTDVVNIRNAGLLNASAASNLKGFEILDLGGGTGTYDLGLGSLGAVALQIDQGIAGKALSGAATVLRAAKDVSLTYAGQAKAGDFVGSANTLTIQLADATGTTAAGNAETFTIRGTLRDGNADGVANGHVSTDSIVAGSIERIVVDARVAVADGGKAAIAPSAYRFTVNLQAGAAESLVVTGDATVQIQGATTLGVINRVDASASTAGVTLDLRTHTKAVEFLGGAGVDQYSGGLRGDTIEAGGGADSLRLSSVNATTGAVRDTVRYRTGADSRLTDANGDGRLLLQDDGGYDQVFNFDVKGETDVANTADRIDLTPFAFASATQGLLDVRSRVSVATDLTSIGDLFMAGAERRTAAFTVVGADTYVFVDVDADGAWRAAQDLVIKLVGLSGGITAAALGF